MGIKRKPNSGEPARIRPHFPGSKKSKGKRKVKEKSAEKYPKSKSLKNRSRSPNSAIF